MLNLGVISSCLRSKVIFKDSKAFSQTYDFHNELHSYNDQPALASIVATPNSSSMIYQWFSHGVPYRAEGEPFTVVQQNKDTIMTYDENNEYHSFCDKPAVIVKNKDDSLNTIVKKYWYNHGLNIRGNFQPTIEIVKNGQVERNWNLYEIDIPESSYLSIKANVRSHSVPLWAAWLRELEGISHEQFETYINEEGKWETELPAEWILRSWGINQAFRLCIPSQQNSFPTYQPFTTSLLLKYIKQEEIS